MKTGQGNVSAHKPFISQSPTLPICSISLHYRPDVFPSVCSSGVISIRHFALTSGVTGKWQNWNHSRTFCSTHHRQKIALFSLFGLYFIQPWPGCSICVFIHWDPCQTLSILFCTVYPLFRLYKKHGIITSNSLQKKNVHKSTCPRLTFDASCVFFFESKWSVAERD